MNDPDDVNNPVAMAKDNPVCRFFTDAFRAVRASRLARILLLILLFKVIMFYGFLKGFLFPRYLKPRYESEEHRTEQVIQDLTRKTKSERDDRAH